MSAVDRAKSGEQAVWKANYTPPAPRDTLVAVEGEVFDGTDVEDFTAERVFGHADVFANDLQLRLALWIPNFVSQTSFDDASQKLRDMVLEQEGNAQIFLPDAAQTDVLAQSMCALANTSGGRILLGVDRSGSMVGLSQTAISHLEQQLMIAALQCSPPVPIMLPIEFVIAPKSANERARTVVVVGVNLSHTVHAVRNVVYRRRDGKTTADPTSRVAQRESMAMRGASTIQEAIRIGNAPDIVVLDAQGKDISQVEQLGSSICGLLNAGARRSLVIVRGFATKEQGALSGTLGRVSNGRLGGKSSLLQQAQSWLDAELRHIHPAIGPLQINITVIENERVITIHVPSTLAPVALYKDEGFLWQNGNLQTLSMHEVLTRYFRRVGSHTEHTSTTQAEVEVANLRWPVQPPSALKTNGLQQELSVESGAYDPQQRSVVWHHVRFSERPGTNGLECKLTTRLRQAFLVLDDGVAVREYQGGGPPPLSGQIVIRVEQALASGATINVLPLATQPRGVLANPSIIRRTIITVNISVRAHQLFARRQRTLLLHTRLPDVSFDNERAERVSDLRQAIADTGFWIYQNQTLPDEAENRTAVVLRGIRSTDFHDIHMLVGVRYEPNTLTRESRYHQRVDSKAVQSGQLEVRVLMWGSGDEARSELAQLQLQLAHLIENRLQYLRSE